MFWNSCWPRAPADHRRYALASGCRVVRPASASQAQRLGTQWPPACQRREVAHLAADRRRSEHPTGQRFGVPRWYSQGEREVEIVSACCLWYNHGLIVPLRWVLIRDPRGQFKTQALLCTEQTTDPVQILSWFVQRWQLEVTFQEVRTHLGVETQRQWNDRAIDRSTPVLLGLFSLVTLFAKPYIEEGGLFIRQASWYPKKQATFSDTLALVRYHLWRETTFGMSGCEADSPEVATLLLERMTQTLCYAA